MAELIWKYGLPRTLLDAGMPVRPVGSVHRLDVVDPIRGRIVVMGDPERERQLR